MDDKEVLQSYGICIWCKIYGHPTLRHEDEPNECECEKDKDLLDRFNAIGDLKDEI